MAQTMTKEEIRYRQLEGLRLYIAGTKILSRHWFRHLMNSLAHNGEGPCPSQ